MTIIAGTGGPDRPDRMKFQPPSPSLATVARMCASLMVIAMSLVAMSAAARADSRPYIWTSSADMFWCTSTQDLCANTTVTSIPGGTPMQMICWRDDRQPFPNSSPRWFYIFLDNGQEGYVWAPQVAQQTPNTPNCNAVNWLNVSDWAIGRIGLTQWRSSQADGPASPQNAGHYWSGWCLTFASNAWKVAGGDGMVTAASANAAWYQFLGQGRANTSGSRPPRGALVFWDTGQFGHVAISIGNWQAIGTRGYDGDTQPISKYGVDPTGHSLGTFRGWVMPTANTPYNTN